MDISPCLSTIRQFVPDPAFGRARRRSGLAEAARVAKRQQFSKSFFVRKSTMSIANINSSSLCYSRTLSVIAEIEDGNR